MSLEWMDVHCHLDKLEEGVEAALEKAFAAGVKTVFTIGTDPNDHPVVLEIAKKHYPKVFCTLGVHPHDGSTYTAEVGEFIEKNLHHPWVCAVGEIGLDYYYNQSSREEQLAALEAQLEIAARHQMPVEIHTRDAEADTITMLKKFEGRVDGLIHCFTGTQWLADEALKLGFNISISGVVTFKNAEALRSVVRSVPLDRLHVETDSPFLSPVPHRGQKCTPAYVVDTAKVVAELKGVSMETLAKVTKENALRLFKKIQVV